jgi:hypothetical protein
MIKKQNKLIIVCSRQYQKTLLCIFWMSVTGLSFTGCRSGSIGHGLDEKFTDISGWYEVLPSGDTVTPSVKLETGNDGLTIHHQHRSLEEAYKWCPWIKWKRDFSTNLRKKYDTIDLDKYHYVVLDLVKKGSSSYFDINGFQTKLGYTTGITAIDLKDYDDAVIKGRRGIEFGIDLQDNNTTLVIKELKFTSELTHSERQRLAGEGLTIREEKLKARPFHGLSALRERAENGLPVADGEEMTIFRDDATGAVTTRLTSAPGDDNFGEGGIWSEDGAALKFENKVRKGGIPVCLPGEGRIISGPADAPWSIWSREDPDILYAMRRNGLTLSVFAWNKRTWAETGITQFNVPDVGSYVEFKNFTPAGKLIIGFRETPHLYIVDVKNHNYKYVRLPVRLKDATIGPDEKTITYANCYTFEIRTFDTETGKEDLAPSFSAGHASWGRHGMVANFGGHLDVFVPDSIGNTFNPGGLIKIWSNWKNDIVTDYGSLTVDNKYVFTNGRKADVDSQHLMIPSSDPGAIMRVAKYFTRFSWTSTTYSRPSPDYTKLIYNENMLGSTELHMVYTRRPDAPENVRLEGRLLKWDAAKRCAEIKGYNIYSSDKSGRDFMRINDSAATGFQYSISDPDKFYSVTAIEYSGLESELSGEVSAGGPRSFYFEAEDLAHTAPARRFFDGYCNNFQCVRINAESDSEKSREGIITIPSGKLQSGAYELWARVKGSGTWKTSSGQAIVDEKIWAWKKLCSIDMNKDRGPINLTSSDDGLMLDMILLTVEKFVPTSPCPVDCIAPSKVGGLSLIKTGRLIHLTWLPAKDKDLHHYSVYCGRTTDFECNNETIVRSVLKTSVTDIVPGKAGDLYYKVIAVDNRWNESEPALVKFN